MQPRSALFVCAKSGKLNNRNWLKAKTNYLKNVLKFETFHENMFQFFFVSDKLKKRRELLLISIVASFFWVVSFFCFYFHGSFDSSLLLFFSISYLHCCWGDYWNTREWSLLTCMPSFQRIHFIQLHVVFLKKHHKRWN